jgi:hypothetical protein
MEVTMAQVETMTIRGISFVVTRTNPGGHRPRRPIRLSSSTFDIAHSDGWGGVYNPDSARKWAVVYPDGSTLNNKAGYVRTFGGYETAIDAALKVANCHN